MHGHSITYVELLEHGFEVSHEECASTPTATPVLPVGTVFHADDKVDSVLVLHLVNIEIDVGPLSPILFVGDVLFQTFSQCLDGFERSIIRDC